MNSVPISFHSTESGLLRTAGAVDNIVREASRAGQSWAFSRVNRRLLRAMEQLDSYACVELTGVQDPAFQLYWQASVASVNPNMQTRIA